MTMYSSSYIVTLSSIFICSLTFGVTEISVMTTQMSSGIAAKSLFQRPCGRQDAFAEKTKTKIMKKKHNKTSVCSYFFLMLNICLSLLVFFFNTLCISSLLPKDFVSYHFLFLSEYATDNSTCSCFQQDQRTYLNLKF